MSRLVGFEIEDQGTVLAVPQCCECMRFLGSKDAAVIFNDDGPKRFTGFVCKRHGEVQPVDWGWDDGSC